MIPIDMSEIYELDRGTASPSEKHRRLALLKSIGTPYKSYNARVEKALVNISIELKRRIDQEITPVLQAHINQIMDGRFPKVYADVKVYPNTHQEDKLSLEDNQIWDEEYLHVFVNFVVSIPKNDSLDTMARATLISFFNSEDDWLDSNSKLNKLKKKLKLYKSLNIDFITNEMRYFNFDGFNPNSCPGVNLEIDCDGIIESKFEVLKQKSLGPNLLSKRLDKNFGEFSLEDITLKNVKTQSLIVIAKLLDALEVKNVSPKKLKRTDSLFALSKYDDLICKSLIQSFKMHFDVIEMIGGPNIITVGDAVDFATDIIEMREE
jgi:hypothetical protein